MNKQRNKKSDRPRHSYDGEHLFTKQLQLYNLYIHPVESDGNCMFRSIADQLYGDTTKHKQIRKSTTDYMLQQRDEFSLFCEHGVDQYDTYVHRMSQLGCWGDYTVLNAITRLYNVNITIWQYNTSRMEINNVSQNSDTRTLHISYHNQSHYASIRNIGDNFNQTPTIINISNKRVTANYTTPSITSNAVFDITQLNDSERTIYQQTGCTDMNTIRNTLYDCNNDIDTAIQVIMEEQNIADPQPINITTSNSDKHILDEPIINMDIQSDRYGSITVNLLVYGRKIDLFTPVPNSPVQQSTAPSKTKVKLRKREIKRLKKQEKAMKRKNKQQMELDMNNHHDGDDHTELIDKLGSIII